MQEIAPRKTAVIFPSKPSGTVTLTEDAMAESGVSLRTSAFLVKQSSTQD
jgi:hypothetical protein